MAKVKNVLFIMADQLRADHLSCYGHPHLQTTHIDRLARRGVLFEQAFVNSGVCGPSRMSYYTGRYPSTHGATWNRVPLSIDEVTLGEYLRERDIDLVLAGKTHVMPDNRGLQRLQIDGQSELGVLLQQGGFVQLDRYDGHREPGAESGYPAYLRAQGYDSPDPWTDYVIAVEDDRGQVQSGWHMRNVNFPSRVKEAHSETAYMTNCAMAYMQSAGDKPWVMHLSYVKPHWPYVAPAPYHAMYSPQQCLPVRRTVQEKENAHPVVQAYRRQEESLSFSSDECVARVRPAYQGLIKQLDDHLGRLFEYMESAGLMDNTLVIITADHGDLLGDHWLGEKELFYDVVQRVPLIIYDPSEQADATRGRRESRLVESVDIVPTILAALDMHIPAHRVEGRQLQPLVHGEPVAWRDCVFSELDYSYREARLILGKSTSECRAWSVRTERWRYVYWSTERPQLFDLQKDPDEFNDLGDHPEYEAIRSQMKQRLLDWFASLKRRTTVTEEEVDTQTNQYKQAGVFYGQW
ncbi:MAG TPA: alkaline phosphatase family protein [Advenella sp.]|nr:alkaline phosphatase family protein [Advenella sp.]